VFPEQNFDPRNDILSPKLGQQPFANRLDGQSLYLSDPELAESSMIDVEPGMKSQGMHV